MSVKLVNTNQTEVVRQMLKTSLETDLFADTILHFPDSGIGRTLRCHRIVLMSASPLLKSLLISSEFMNPHEDIHLSLPGVRIEDASRILSLIYKGSMRVPQTSILHTSQIIELLHLKVQNNNSSHLEQVRKQLKRPLLMKQTPTQKQQPLILVLPSSSQPSKFHMDRQGPSPSSKGIRTSHQKSKVLDKKKFICDECGRGFSLACLLKRHKTAHSGIKPHKCVYCDKTFTSGTSLRNHEFSKHLDERIRRRKAKSLLSQRGAQSVRIYKAENSLDGSETYVETMSMEDQEISPPVTVLETSQTDMDTVIEIVETSSASEDSGITTYSIRSSTPTEAPILYNVDFCRENESNSVFWAVH